jgi:hypothetical protein
MKGYQRGLLLAIVAMVTIMLLFFGIHQTSDVEISSEGISIGWKNNGQSPSHKNEKLAYAIFLSGTLDQDEDLEEDKYFVAVRIAIWQLLHKKDTRACGIDVVAMVGPVFCWETGK